MQQLQPQAVVDVLLFALQQDNTSAVQAMSRLLPGAERLTAAKNVKQLLQLAEAKGIMGKTGRKYKWFAAVAAQLKCLQS
jgi:hypothetical protein